MAKKPFIPPLRNKAGADTEQVDQQPEMPGESAVLTPLLRVPDDDQVTELSTLTEQEQQQLMDCEALVDKGLDQYFETGVALEQIRRQKLYRSSHLTWASYIRDRFDISRRRSYQMMDAARLIEELTIDIQHELLEDAPPGLARPGLARPGLAPAGVPPVSIPKKEAHAAALKEVPRENRVAVWADVQEEATASGTPITGRKIRESAEKITGVPLNKKAPKDRKPRTAKADDDEEFSDEQTRITVGAMRNPWDEPKPQPATGIMPDRSDGAVDAPEIPDENTVDDGGQQAPVVGKQQPGDPGNAAQRIRQALTEAMPGEVMVSVKGSFLLRQGLSQAWQHHRRDEREINENYSDSLTIQELLDLLGF